MRTSCPSRARREQTNRVVFPRPEGEVGLSDSHRIRMRSGQRIMPLRSRRRLIEAARESVYPPAYVIRVRPPFTLSAASFLDTSFTFAGKSLSVRVRLAGFFVRLAIVDSFRLDIASTRATFH